MDQQPVMMVYITAPNRDEALKLATILVQERLAACANIHDGLTSLYWWQGQMEQAPEASLIVKTRADLIEALQGRVRELHSYSVPCIVAWPVTAGYEPFLDWVRNETRAI
jgi:periplasmic divalent cation tolerance protein